MSLCQWCHSFSQIVMLSACQTFSCCGEDGDTHGHSGSIYMPTTPRVNARVFSDVLAALHKYSDQDNNDAFFVGCAGCDMHDDFNSVCCKQCPHIGGHVLTDVASSSQQHCDRDSSSQPGLARVWGCRHVPWDSALRFQACTCHRCVACTLLPLITLVCASSLACMHYPVYTHNQAMSCDHDSGPINMGCAPLCALAASNIGLI